MPADSSTGLSAVAARFEQPCFGAGGDSVSGTVRGLAVRWRYASDGVGSGVSRWTECEVRLPRAAPLSLQLAPRSLDLWYYVRVGLAVEVKLDHRAFDRAFIVDGVPADIVRGLLSPPLREDLLARLGAHRFGASGELEVIDDTVVLKKSGWLEDREEALAFADLAIALAERIPAAVGEADARALRQSGGAYRESQDGAAARALKAGREQELHQRWRLRLRRSDPGVQLRRSAILFVAVLGILALGCALIGVSLHFCGAP